VERGKNCREQNWESMLAGEAPQYHACQVVAAQPPTNVPGHCHAGVFRL